MVHITCEWQDELLMSEKRIVHTIAECKMICYHSAKCIMICYHITTKDKMICSTDVECKRNCHIHCQVQELFIPLLSVKIQHLPVFSTCMKKYALQQKQAVNSIHTMHGCTWRSELFAFTVTLCAINCVLVQSSTVVIHSLLV